MKSKGTKLKVSIVEDEFQEKIYSGLLGPKELRKTLKKIKQKFS